MEIILKAQDGCAFTNRQVEDENERQWTTELHYVGTYPTNDYVELPTIVCNYWDDVGSFPQEIIQIVDASGNTPFTYDIIDRILYGEPTGNTENEMSEISE